MKKLLKKWIETGYISSETTQAILDDIKERNFRLQGEIYCFILYLLAISPLLLFLDNIDDTLPLLVQENQGCFIPFGTLALAEGKVVQFDQWWCCHEDEYRIGLCTCYIQRTDR